jgi:xylan 1,4-beta-xylosidase
MKRLVCVLLFLLPGSVVIAQTATSNGFRRLKIDAGKIIGDIHDFQSLNGGPMPAMADLPNLSKQYKGLRVNLVRTHDMMGPTDIDAKFEFTNSDLAWLIPDNAQRAGVVEAGNKSIIFPDFKADPEKAGSYNFGPTDKVMAAIQASGAHVYYRVGRSWGANIGPPVDFDKYADVVKHIAMHYNQGWANGFHYHIQYWEFWNEPDGLFWSATPEQFYQLYEKTARALKSVDPSLKVGGVGLANSSHVSPYREGLLDYCAGHRVPLDFYSWHHYAIDSADPYDYPRLAKRFRTLLNERGFTKAESIVSEWNLTPDFTAAKMKELRSAHNAAFISSVLTYLQDAPVDVVIFYRGDAAWMGLFDLQGKYYKTAYAYKAMGQMLDTPLRLAVEGNDDLGFATLAGRSADGNKVQILISNYAIPAGYKPGEMHRPSDLPSPTNSQHALPSELTHPGELPRRTGIVYHDNAGYNLTIQNLPWKQAFTIKRYRISNTQNFDLVEKKTTSGEILNLSNAMPPDTVELIVLEHK